MPIIVGMGEWSMLHPCHAMLCSKEEQNKSHATWKLSKIYDCRKAQGRTVGHLGKWKKILSLHPLWVHGGDGLVTKSCPTLATPWTVTCQAPLSMGFPRQEYWNGLPFLSPANLPNPGIEPESPALLHHWVTLYIVLNAQKNVWRGSKQTGKSGYIRRVLGLGLGPLGEVKGNFSFICNVIILL